MPQRPDVVNLPPSSLPLVGRAPELDLIQDLLRQAAGGRGGTLILCGESGVGKSRLLRLAGQSADCQGWRVAVGRAYPVETGVPYALFSDALLPLLRGLSPESRAALTRGSEAELAQLAPVLDAPGAPLPGALEDPAEFKSRFLWSVSQFLSRLAERQPLLLQLEDLQWADASSLELLHFLARQIGSDRVALLCTYNEAQRDQNPRLGALEQSLVSLQAARVHRVDPLSRADTDALVREAFGVTSDEVREFTALLYGWTRGNPFFLEETLKSLVRSGQLRQSEGGWVGWDVSGIELPRSIRDAVLIRLAGLTPAARAAAELLAVIGTSTSHAALRAVSGQTEEDLVEALDELRRQRVVDEALSGDTVLYDFSHPVLRDTLYGELGLARARLLHARIAAALEAFYAPDPLAHADELAYHYARTHAHDLASKAVRYLAVAGRNALAKYAAREAADYLSAALERAGEASAGSEPEPQLLHDLARARQRLGEFDAAIALWERLRDAARRVGDPVSEAGAERRLGLAHYWSGQHLAALERFEAGLACLQPAGNDVLRARLRLARGECLQELGRPDDARREMEEALAIAERGGEPELLARAHLALLLLHTWTGPPQQAREHGARALELTAQSADPALRSTVHWGLAVLAGLTGDAAATAHHIAECERLADEIRSPLHRIRVAEIAIEFASNTGDWEAALATGERTIASARALNQRILLPRLLVWTGMIRLGRGDLERGRRYVDEAWELSGAGRGEPSLDVHTVVPAHCGRAAYHLAVGEYAEAVRVGEAGLAIADRTGYTVWAIHRLLPIIAEAYVSLGDVQGATRTGARLRRDAERLGHQLGLAWADACDAFLVWLRGDIAAGIERMRAAAERLEAIPVVPDAARLRRHFAARLRDHGERDEALRELRRIHEVFARLGAERELQKTREQIRELGARPPARETGAGLGGLSVREIEIARLVAARKSNKTIARTLDISPRTVSTHLSNIFRKLEIASRGELADRIRELDVTSGAVAYGER